MKIYFFKSNLYFIVLSMLFMSCLKDKAYDNGEIQSLRATSNVAKVIEIKLTAASTKNFHSYSYNNSNNDTIVDFLPINLAATEVASEDIHVTVSLNNSLITNYNDSNSTSYVIPTEYTIVNNGNVVVIPKGSHTGYLQIKFKPSSLLGTSYALGFTIIKVAEAGYIISGNNQNGIAVINIKNEFDGNYHVVGRRVHPTLGNFDFDYNADLNTTSANSNMGNILADLKEGLNIIVNPDNTVSLVGDARNVFLQAGKVNKYDPITKTYTLNYFYNTGAPRLITQTLIKN